MRKRVKVAFPNSALWMPNEKLFFFNLSILVPVSDIIPQERTTVLCLQSTGQVMASLKLRFLQRPHHRAREEDCVPVPSMVSLEKFEPETSVTHALSHYTITKPKLINLTPFG